MQWLHRASITASRQCRVPGISTTSSSRTTRIRFAMSRDGPVIADGSRYIGSCSTGTTRDETDDNATRAELSKNAGYGIGFLDKSAEMSERIWNSMKTPPKGFENFFPKRDGGEGENAGPPSPDKKPSSDKKYGAERKSSSNKKEADTSSKKDTTADKSGEKRNPFEQFGSSKKSDEKQSGGGQQQNSGNNPQMGSAIAMAIFLIGASVLLTNDDSSTTDSREVTWTDFRNYMLEPGHVEKIVITNKKTMARVYLKPGCPSLQQIQQSIHSSRPMSKQGTGEAFEEQTVMEMGLSGPGSPPSAIAQSSTGHQFVYKFAIGSVDSFEKKLDATQREMGIAPRDFVRVRYTDESSLMGEVFSIAPSLLLAGMVFFALRGMSGGGMGGKGGMGGIFQVGKSTHQKVNGDKVTTTFADVAGCQEAKREIMEFVDFLKDGERFLKLGAKIPKGALLCGPPGTGKTLLAKAVAGEAGVPFFSISGSDFIEMFVGVGPSRVRDLFKEARENSPCIVFIDEIDAVGRERGQGGMGGGNDERENTLNQLLVEMDGFSPSTGVVILAGTNRPDILDKALTRPGRFDRQIMVDKPDLQGRKEIFLVHLKGITLFDEAEKIAGRLAGLTPGFAGADIANLCNEAAIQGARRAADTVTMADFEKATDRIIGGLESNKIMSQEEKSIVAHHEAGHAVAGWFLEHADPLLKVTIIPRSSGALGYAQYLPKEVNLRNQEQIMDIVCMALAGRAAEEIFFGRVTNGAADDLRRVTEMIYSTIQVYGFNDRVGQLAFPKDPNSMGGGDKPYSEATAQAMDEEARKIVEAAYARTLNLLKERKEELTKVAEELLDKETITHDDVYDLIGARPFQGDAAYTEYVSRRFEDKKEAEESVDEKVVEEEIVIEEASPPLTPGLA